MADFSRVEFLVNLNDANAHVFNIEMSISGAVKNQKFSLPAWTPGSYMLREHAQHIVDIRAFSSSVEIEIQKINKNTFVTDNNKSDIKLIYQVYAFDTSIRAAFIDDQQAFFNGSSLFFRPHGFEKNSYVVNIRNPEKLHTKSWQVATSMPIFDVDAQGFGKYQADNYEELIDYPVQIGELLRLNFTASGVPHEMVLVDDVRAFEEQRVIGDLKILCEEHISLFGQSAPFANYLFIARFMENGFGGLEHRNSSMLLSTPYCLPKVSKGEPDEKYQNFLGLCSHEYFHSWNVKRLMPKEFSPYDLEQECYTNMLWVFEGITSYYDDLLLKKSGLISLKSYLDILSKRIRVYLGTPGRHLQTLAQSSFDAWIKFYRPNENSRNSCVSYYLQGSLLALVLDLSIRKNSQNHRSLDDVMKLAYKKYGAGRGISEEEFFSCLLEAGDLNINNFKNKFIYGKDELPIAEMLSYFGVELELKPDEYYLDDKIKMQTYLGFKVSLDSYQRAIISYVATNSPAMDAGLSVNDEIVAINNVRLDGANFASIFTALRDVEEIYISYARNKRLLSSKLLSKTLPLHACIIKVKDNICDAEKHMLAGWLKVSG